jgi:YVTN family beta-propeller protein
MGLKLRVFLAGRVAVERDGAAIGEERFPGRQGRLLFAYLVAEQGRPVPRDELAEALWGEAPPATWEKALTVLVSKLRGLLAESGLDGAKVLTSAFGCYRLDLPEGTWVDVIAANDAVAEAEAALAADDLEHAEAVATQGASLARPLFLSGEEGDWVDAKRRELSDILRRALSCLAEACLRSGDEAAAKWAEEAIALEPYRETGYRHLMAAHAAAGNRAEALRVYEQCRQLLATELGAYPSPETESIYRELLEAPSPEPRTAPPEPAPVPVSEREPLRPEAPARMAAPSYRRRRTVVIGALAGVIAAAVAIPLFALGGDGASRMGLGETSGNVVGVLDAGSGAVRGAVRLTAPPTAVAAGFGLVWAASADANAVYAIDPDTNTRQETIPVEDTPAGIAVGGGYVWVTNSLAGTVSQIDPQALIELQSIRVGNGPTGIDVDEGGHVWVANTTDHTVAKIRARDGKFLKSYPAGTDPGAVAVGAGAVWVASKSNGTVLKLNPRDGQPLKTIDVGENPAAVVVGLGSVWVANSGDGTVSQIDPDTTAVRDTIRVGAGPSGITVVRGEVWTANELAGTVSRIDPATPDDATTLSLGSRPSAVATGDGTAYVALRPTEMAHRGGTLRVAVPTVEPFATLDPAVVYVGDIGRLLPLTNDGLLAYRRVGGQAERQLVHDLALSMPEVSPDGKTYRFQLRPNIRYSNGRVVRASDFRYTIERVFKLRLRGLDVPGGLSVAKEYFRGILGADRCSRRHCDLAAGIVTDDAARTVRFELSAPDANFLYKLASTFAAVVPAGTSLQEAKRRPLPATGPYRIASFAPNRSVRLIRNPRFREWSKAAQPAGLPAEIVVKVVPALKERIALVKQGKADLTSSRTLHLFPVPPALKPWVHSHPVPATSFLAFNTNRPPFDDLRARQAVNYALDRNQVVQLAGGEVTARPTCQVLPPNFAGYRRYCPYTADPSADGGWTAPDRVKAAELVADSATAGAAVTLWIPSLTGIGLGPYLADLLESLDYRVQLRSSFGRKGTNPADAYFGQLAAVTKPRALPQILWSGWAADYPAASNFIEPLFSCGSPDNRAHFCERALDRKIGRALKLQQTDLAGANRLWTELDREITDKALWVPLYNVYEADLVSKRVGNYQYNPRWGALLSQLWVR